LAPFRSSLFWGQWSPVLLVQSILTSTFPINLPAVLGCPFCVCVTRAGDEALLPSSLTSN
jgi:hypothetical protein